MSRLDEDDDNYRSEDDEDYELPEDAPPEDGNDAYLIADGEPNDDASAIKSSRDADALWESMMSDTEAAQPTSAAKPDAQAAATAVVDEDACTSKAKAAADASVPPSTPVNSTGTKRKWTPKAGGSSALDAALGSIKRAKKTSVLDKSQSDWNTFVDKSSIKDELASHNKSRSSYLDKQDFLAKTDYQQFVRERDMRASARKQP